MDYKPTLNLPRTDFAMKADLPRREPATLARWDETRLHERVLVAHAADPRYVLHDGPPYANGNIHYGHILNKILKDIVARSRTMAGRRVVYRPGWDCHGLPIELAVDRELGGRKKEMSKVEVRRACADYARRFVDVQRGEFRRLGVAGTWETPYLTMAPDYEAAIARALADFADRGFLYKGDKPVHWCWSCRTALAEAEVEYEDHTSPSIYVAFPLVAPAGDRSRTLGGVAVEAVDAVIWTTTPWTLAANLAIAYHPDFRYALVRPQGPAGRGDRWLLVAAERVALFAKECGLEIAARVDLSADEVRALAGMPYRHPLLERPPVEAPGAHKLYPADHVTLEQGTGLVHTAPGHGHEDFVLGREHGLPPYAPVGDDGRYTAAAPYLAGERVLDANPKVVALLVERGALLSDPKATVRHSYPHCWRCKHPVIFRATPQWFARMDHQDLRRRALEEIDRTRWIPPWGRNRIYGMIEHRPDWVLSRQRVWGVPIPVFYCTACEPAEAVCDGAVMRHVADLFAAHGADVWYEREAAALAPPGTKCPRCGGTSLRKEEDIVDVWFESGVSWAAVCEGHEAEGLGVPVDLYLEGSDQHRGWFHSALLTAVATRGRAPYRAVLTHGFVLDEQGRPYSKSEIEKARREGKKFDYVPPDEVLKTQGAETLRLWVASVDFRADIPYSRTILAQLGESYRKIRNTFRFLLGNLADFDPARDAVPEERLGAIDRMELARLRQVARRVRRAYDDYELHVVFRTLLDYCVVDLSARYLDVTKDRLYCDEASGLRRRSTQTVMYEIARALALLAAPVLAFTADEVWGHLSRRPGDPDSVHLGLLPAADEAPGAGARDTEALATLEAVVTVRDAVQKALEPFRAQKRSSTDAAVTVTAPPGARDQLAALDAAGDLEDLLLVSSATVAPGEAEAAAPVVAEARGAKCPRCWKIRDLGAEGLCGRCAGVVKAMDRKETNG